MVTGPTIYSKAGRKIKAVTDDMKMVMSMMSPKRLIVSVSHCWRITAANIEVMAPPKIVLPMLLYD